MFALVTNFLEPISYLIYLAAVVLHLKADRSIKMKVLVAFYMVSTTLMADASFKVFEQQSNIWLYNVVLLAAIVAIGFYAYKILHAIQKRITVLVLVSGTILYFMVRNILLRHMFDIDSIGFVLLCVSVTVFSFMYFHQLLNNITENTVFYNFDFWLISGYLLYYLASFFIFLCFNYFTYKIALTNHMIDRELLTILWGVHNVFLFLSAVLTLIGSLWTTYYSPSR